jgi:hypothetical protein
VQSYSGRTMPFDPPIVVNRLESLPKRPDLTTGGRLVFLRVRLVCSASAATIGIQGCPTDQTPVFSTLSGHTGPHGSSPDGGGNHIVAWPAGEWTCRQLPGWAEVSPLSPASGRLLSSSLGSGQAEGLWETCWSCDGLE